MIKINKILILLIFIFALILGIGCVSAAELTQDNQTINNIDDQNDLSINESNGCTATDFNGLRNYIQTHDVVELENDISRGSGQYQPEIEIVKNITIDGKGHTINGATGPHYQGRIFLVKENATLILKNLILIDSYCQSPGGVILCLGNIICYNCTFKNNIGEYDGGAICSQNGIEVYD